MSVTFQSPRSTSKEQRRHNFRVRTERPVLCFGIDPDQGLGERVPALTVDISSQGIGLRHDGALDRVRSIAVHMHFSAPDIDIVALASKVRTNGPFEAAYRFETLSTEARAALARFVFAEATRLRTAPGSAVAAHGDDPIVNPLDACTQRLASATGHVRAADADLRAMQTLLRQQGSAVPPEIELVLARVREALDELEA